MGYLDYHTCNFYGLHTNVKFRAIFKINIVNFLIIHVITDFNGNYHKILGCILRRLWTCFWTFKMTTLYLSHKKNENCGFKKMSKQCQNKNKISSNEEFISEVH
jgi:hypothetical protein